MREGVYSAHRGSGLEGSQHLLGWRPTLPYLVIQGRSRACGLQYCVPLPTTARHVPGVSSTGSILTTTAATTTAQHPLDTCREAQGDMRSEGGVNHQVCLLSPHAYPSLTSSMVPHRPGNSPCITQTLVPCPLAPPTHTWRG